MTSKPPRQFCIRPCNIYGPVFCSCSHGRVLAHSYAGKIFLHYDNIITAFYDFIVFLMENISINALE